MLPVQVDQGGQLALVAARVLLDLRTDAFYVHQHVVELGQLTRVSLKMLGNYLLTVVNLEAQLVVLVS